MSARNATACGISGRRLRAAASGWLVASAYLTPVQAQVLPVLKITKSAVSGAEILVAQASGWNNITCATIAHTVNVTRQPSHGTISVVDEDTTIPASTQRSGSTGPCAGKPLRDKKISYTSEPGFIGGDSFAYESVDARGGRSPYEVIINVTAPR